MNGGRYLTIFPDNNDRVIRSLLYSLESFGVIKLIKEKEGNWNNYQWELTKKGKDIVETEDYLQDFLKAKNILKFCQEFKYLLDNQQ
ncbi:hypothetical protein COU58_04530 [Candidatus Pacearchaeota archaeon CG10_big_fil_rev_8_21_14_0_10_32_42]|nr:MAG: hypothetical protein COU58_04530 [Candidatus Pacearchaeota archaeon CG10_big_fil_rev_8_21_14_0_10_32_42]